VSERGPILCGYDGTEHARDGLALTRLLAETLEVDVVVLSVLTYGPTEATWAEYERMLHDDQERLAGEAREALSGLGEIETVMIPGSSPARELHDLAEAREASLVSIGSTHRGRLGRIVPGTVADRLLAGAPCPVTVAPAGYAPSENVFGRIAVAYDGSAESKAALTFAVELARLAASEFELIVVANPHEAVTAVPMAGGYAGMVTTKEGVEREERRLQAVLDDAVASIDGRVRAGGEVVVDVDPSSVIKRASERSDLLLIGSRGYGPIGRVLLGGVSSRVVRDASCPVIVTPRSAISAAIAEDPAPVDA
jgi:nucleotide-binding universal stress UspA family protein